MCSLCLRVREIVLQWVECWKEGTVGILTCACVVVKRMKDAISSMARSIAPTGVGFSLGSSKGHYEGKGQAASRTECVTRHVR